MGTVSPIRIFPPMPADIADPSITPKHLGVMDRLRLVRSELEIFAEDHPELHGELAPILSEVRRLVREGR